MSYALRCRGRWFGLLSAVPLAGLSLLAAASFASAQTAGGLIEAESMALPAKTYNVADTRASGGRATHSWSNGTLSKRVTASAATRLVVRARGDQCRGAPRMVVKVDGAQALAASVPATAWTDYAASVSVPAGAHTVTVTYDNDSEPYACDRNLRLDKITLSGSTTPPPPPPADTSPASAPTGFTATGGNAPVDLDGAGSSAASSAPPAGIAPPGPTSGIRMGVGSNADFASDAMMDRHQAMGSPSVRAEFSINTDPAAMDATMGKFNSRAIRPLVLAGFHNYVPTEAQATSFCGGVASRYGLGGSEGMASAAAVRYIEFGNESSYSYQSGSNNQPEAYARAFRACANAVAGTSVKLLIQAEDHGANRNWVDRMYVEVPNLNTYISGGWTTHPYGPQSRADGILDKVMAQTAAHGSQAPVFVTEWGTATDNGRTLSDNYAWPRNMTYSQARDALVGTLNRWKPRYPRLREFYYFQTKDRAVPGASGDRESYFGLQQLNGAPKQPLYDAFRAYVANGI